MALESGSRLGHYEVTTFIGEGGMGRVYRATDTRLNRHVALKTLPEAFAADPERLARFRREAQVLASLNHPNIAAIHGLEEAGGTHALVLEFVEGPTLADRIALGPLPLDEALPIARQIANGLQAAHEQGIVHRDLKPANIKITPDGVVKVLDFGLAKALVSESDGPAAHLSQSPTITSPAAMTRAGVLLGTAAYMSPEQAKGRAADRRSDVWALGCVIFEMLAGRRAFEGDDVSDTLANVLKSAPDWNALPPNVPAPIRTVLRRCLEKDRAKRVSDTAIVAFVLDEASSLEEPGGSGDTAPKPVGSGAVSGRWPLAAIAAFVAAVLSGLAVWNLGTLGPPLQVTRLTIANAGDGALNIPTGQHTLAISPDGSRFVYVGNGQLFLRDLSRFDAQALSVTNAGGRAINTPVFSPDGQSLAFHSVGDRAIKKVAAAGGPAVTVCSADDVFGMTWDQSGIVFGRGRGGIARCPAAGGAPEQLASVEDGEEAHGPQILPGGQAMLFTVGAIGVGRGQWDRERWDRARIVFQPLPTGERKTLIDGGSDARYVSTGHLLYALGGVVFGVPFDTARQQVIGQAVPVIEGVRRTIAGTTGAAQFAVSANGNLIYLPGPADPETTVYGIALANRLGALTRLPVPTGAFTHVRASRDGARLAIGSDDTREAAIWIYQLGGTGALQRLTLEGRNKYPVWAPDGRRLAFQSDRAGDRAIFAQRIDGSAAERLTKPADGEAHVPESWSADGQHLLFTVEKGATFSLRVLSIADAKISPLAVESHEPLDAVFSPNGRWIAYAMAPTRDTSSPNRGVFVQPFPDTGARYPVPKSRVDYQPAWTPDGTELVYVSSITAGLIAAVTVTSQPGLTFGPPITFPGRVNGDKLPDHGRAYDILPDGRFVGIVAESKPEERTASELRAVLNWREELRRMVPIN
jgi:Tol biopolymer transport system component